MLWVTLALAQDASEPADVTFTDTLDVFSFAAYDSGYLPSADSTLAVRFQVVPSGGVLTDIPAVSSLGWDEDFQHTLEPVPDGGFFGVDTGLDFDLDVQIDVAVWDGVLDVWDTGFTISEAAMFSTFALQDDVRVVVDDIGTFEPFDTSIGIIAGVSLDVAVEVRPELTSILTGTGIDTTLADETVGIDAEGLFASFSLPEEPAEFVQVENTYHAELYNQLDLVVVPSLDLSTPIGGFELASFDIPVELLDLLSERSFEPVVAEHPLPALGPLEVPEAGEVELGGQVNLYIPLESVGAMALEGTARVEGAAGFSVYPPYFAATPGNEAGVVVTFSPQDVGEQLAFLVIESNDPTAGFQRIPLVGHGLSIETPLPEEPEIVEGDPVNGEDIKKCGCASGGTALPVGGMLPLLVLFRRQSRRRSTNFTV